jgi:hypothetical protein
MAAARQPQAAESCGPTQPLARGAAPLDVDRGACVVLADGLEDVRTLHVRPSAMTDVATASSDDSTAGAS